MIKPSMTIICLSFFGSGITLPIMGFVLGELWSATFFLIIWLWCIGLMANHCLINRIILDESGIEFISFTKRYKMRWDEIKIIGIGYIPLKQVGRPPWIYFAANGVSYPLLSAEMRNDKFFMVHYRKAIVDEIKKYWSKEIDGLNSESEFERRNKPRKKLT